MFVGETKRQSPHSFRRSSLILLWAIAGMMVLGIGFVAGLFVLAPRPVANAHHQWSTPAQKCLQCHREASMGPVMTHRIVPLCVVCHRPSKKE